VPFKRTAPRYLWPFHQIPLEAPSPRWVANQAHKDGEHGHAARVITEAARESEDLGEAEDWSVAYQKLALAYRGAGNLGDVHPLITIAGASGTTGTPMQKVRLSTPRPIYCSPAPAPRN
jgi:hypothetical protein